jgi:uncharacterized protein (TIGR02246 family)
MRLSLVLLGVLVLTFAFAQSAVEKQILALEDARNKAIVNGDAKALDELTSDDYTFINLRGGVQLKPEIIKGFASRAYHYESRDIAELKVRVYGDAAVVTGRSTQKGAEDGRDNSGDYRFTRVYVKQHGRWQTVAYQATAIAK